MENNEVKKEESTKVETPAVNSEVETKVAEQPVVETPAAPEEPKNPLIDATVKELNDKMGFRNQ